MVVAVKVMEFDGEFEGLDRSGVVGLGTTYAIVFED
jgi:hypothetical protein